MSQASDGISIEVVKLFFSALVGGVVGAAMKIGVDEWGYRARLMRSAREKLRTYARPLWRTCDELKFRLTVINNDLCCKDEERRHQALQPLSWSPDEKCSLTWYNESGQYVVSTVHLISTLAA